MKKHTTLQGEDERKPHYTPIESLHIGSYFLFFKRIEPAVSRLERKTRPAFLFLHSLNSFFNRVSTRIRLGHQSGSWSGL